MDAQEKIRTLADALRRVNGVIYAAGAPLGSANYFAIREAAVEALKAAGEPVTEEDARRRDQSARAAAK